MEGETRRHEPVLVREVLDLLEPTPGGVYLDLTLGGGGHARAILQRETTARVVGVDRDREVLELTARGMAEFGERFRAIGSRFDEADQVDGGPREGEFHGVLLDLGMSSLQVDDAVRGFSFSRDADLDLRMDRGSGETAAELLNRLSERELGDLLFRFGEERRSRAIARTIVERRRSAPVRRTVDLVDLVLRATGQRHAGRVHPATRTFQALRIAVNDELGCLERVLPKAVRWLRRGGRLAVISFHSLEDRIVKQFLRDRAKEESLRLLTRKPVRPQDDEVRRNPRSRSARMRGAERPASRSEHSR